MYTSANPMITAPILAPADPTEGVRHLVGHLGGSGPTHDDPGRGAGIEGSQHQRLGGRQGDVDGWQRDRAHDGDTAEGHGHVHGPVGASGLAELTGAVKRVDDPESAISRDVLETLFRPHVVVRIEPVQLLDQESMGQPIAHDAHASPGGRPLSQLQEGLSGHGGEDGRVTMFGGQILLVHGCHDAHV
jgi:hypothetical protein